MAHSAVMDSIPVLGQLSAPDKEVPGRRGIGCVPRGCRCCCCAPLPSTNAATGGPHPRSRSLEETADAGWQGAWPCSRTPRMANACSNAPRRGRLLSASAVQTRRSHPPAAPARRRGVCARSVGRSPRVCVLTGAGTCVALAARWARRATVRDYRPIKPCRRPFRLSVPCSNRG